MLTGKLGKTGSDALNIRSAELAYSRFYDDIASGRFSGARAKAADWSLKPMMMLDMITAEAAWHAGEYYGRKHLKLKDQELMRFADDIVERTQGQGIKGSVSDLQTGAATRWLTLLQTFGIADFNLLARDVLGIKNPEMSKGQTMARTARYVVSTLLTAELYRMIGLEKVVPDPIHEYQKAKDEGSGEARAIVTAMGGLIEKVPMLGGSVRFGSNLGGIIGEWGSLAPEAIEEFMKSFDWGNMTEGQRNYAVRTMTRAVGYSLGIPMTNQILKSVKAADKGGNPWQIILGVYDEERSGGGLRPNIPRPSIPRPSF